ncbi:AAA domain-containing protein [Cytophaga aurantiaca]|uniref:AAA domain-containing protein n=1 Tax=Cytophaga aurantiaca TaxID=29530 RepID=UPI000378B45D|nr:AAA domain-containing protein [Cytophaga aurantiaca]
MSIAKEYFQTLKNVLKIEMNEDAKIYEEELSKQSIQERKEIGITWYPLFIKSEYYGFAERLHIEVERKYEFDTPNVFYSGDKVRIFSNHQHSNSKEDFVDGVITASGGNQVTVQLMKDEAPDWLSDGKIGMDKLFDKHSYETMLSTLDYWGGEQGLTKDSVRLRDVILGEKEADFDEKEDYPVPSTLDDSQKKAWLKAIQAKDIAIIHGPPGTGKTTTIVEIVKTLVEKGERVLVCASSNAAVDVLTERIANRGIPVVRLGNPSKITEQNLQYCLERQVTTHAQFGLVKELKKRAEEFFRMANKYKRNFDREEREQRKAILKEAKNLRGQADDHLQFLQQNVLVKNQVVTCTPVVSMHREIGKDKFDTLIFDEAGQTLEPMCWIPIQKVKKVILAGDHLQLPPTVKSEDAAKKGLAISLLEKLMPIESISEMLAIQYRMNTKIMQFPSQWFYENKLEAHASVKDHQLDEAVVQFIDTAGTGYEEELVGAPFGIRNKQEADLVLTILQSIVNEYKHASIGIISPYKLQIQYLREQLIEQSITSKNIQVQTVDGFQGQEKDIIIISLVRSNGKQEIGFLKDLRRMNVAITRARKKLIVIGDSSTLSTSKFYAGFQEYVEMHDGYHSAWEYIS